MTSKIKTFRQAGDTIFWGDALAVLETQIPDASVDLIFADPPYNLGKQFSSFTDRWPSETAYVEWCENWLGICIRKLKATGSLYLMASTQCMPHLDIYLSKHMSIMSRIAWHYDSSGVQAKKYYGSVYEPILFCVKDPNNYTFNAADIFVEARTGAQRKLIDYRKPVPAPYSSRKVPGNVWYFPRVRYRMPEYEHHPSQKPESLLERIVKASSKAGDTVLDPFSGTFTTSAVAQRLGRKTIGIEIEEEFVKTGLRRLGIADQWNGVRLSPPHKPYVRKNGKSKKLAKMSGGKELF
ncbi:MAG: adenine-specific DNA-methyltransferase [Pirellulaceae bacterium]|nr:adenine-specific DNA-methyltransferase [Pirellulaceae bacterium]